jgi:hypothetical protein
MIIVKDKQIKEGLAPNDWEAIKKGNILGLGL